MDSLEELQTSILIKLLTWINMSIQILNRKQNSKSNFPLKIAQTKDEKELLDKWVISTLDVAFLKPLLTFYEKLIHSQWYDASLEILSMLDTVVSTFWSQEQLKAQTKTGKY